jgi:hypothetical protein
MASLYFLCFSVRIICLLAKSYIFGGAQLSMPFDALVKQLMDLWTNA